jgi:long-chain fatty acid transport protein
MSARLVSLLACAMGAAAAYAGSFDYLSNQSAMFSMDTARGAATDGADIATYNPAGAALMEKGWYFDLSNQTFLKFYSEDEDALLGETYKQHEPTYSLPSFFAVRNFGEVGPGRLAAFFSAGIPAGGGSLKWEDGNKIASQASSSLTGTDLAVDASSVYYGVGVGAAYSLFDNRLSASAGLRYTMARRSGKISGTMSFTNATYGAWTLDVEDEYDYTANGFTPIFGIDVRPLEGLTIGIRYEMETPLRFEYDITALSATASNSAFSTVASGVASALDNDGEKKDQDLPQILGVGAEYRLTPAITLGLSSNFYFLGQADLDGLEDYFGTGVELCGAVSYKASERLGLSGTFMYTKQNVKDSFYEADDELLLASAGPFLDSLFFGAGATYTAAKNLDILGAVAYIDYLKRSATTASGLEVSYKKDIVNLCVGLRYKI